MTKRQKEKVARVLAEVWDDGGIERLCDFYNSGMPDDGVPDEVMREIVSDPGSVLIDELEEYMYIALAKKYARRAGGKFVSRGK